MDRKTLQQLANGFIAALGETKEEDGLIVRRPVIVRADSINEKNRTVRMLASSDAVDSYGDIVEQDFLLDRYQKNPVVLYGHNRVGAFGMGGAPEWTLPIGYSTEVGVGADGLEATLHIVTKKANPLAETVWQGFLEQSIRASSIGFFPHEIDEEQNEETGELIYRLRKNELFEISVVPIGANPDAVALSAERTKERAWFQKQALALRETQSARTISIPPSPEPAPTEEKEAPMTDAEKKELDEAKKAQEKAEKALETAQKTATEATARAEKAETALKAKADTETRAGAEAEVRALVGSKLNDDQVGEFVELRLEAPERFKSIVSKLPDLAGTDATSVEKDVDELVGKKITTAQKDDFVALRKLDPKLFKSITAGLLDIPHTKSVTPADKTPTKNKAATRAPSAIARNARAAGEKARDGEASA